MGVERVLGGWDGVLNPCGALESVVGKSMG